ncbi:proline iminopeptidase [Aureimonas endophytica]|uniref:Proline iminopeptidase n=1 Tax=Aureimonas endophytica TaxID=2027858 RepID=A0A916ZZ94_9HYPH|nr:prolyl aminopeptidase [Aureimonas endophytica]GGE18685.1 proline iminopeptidase [Aureimonas endophytica]
MSDTPRQPYPAIEPYRTGRLAVGDGHELHWELCGDPAGLPAVFLHGGPGSGFMSQHRRLFDPARYNVLLFDQRGSGRSTPSGGLDANTTHHLVADMERLRTMLGIPSWLVFGGSWGATLALAYAEAHPERVRALVLRGVFTGRQVEIDWFYGGRAGLLFSDHWAEFLAPLTEAERGDPVAAFHRRLADPEPRIRAEAAAAWAGWERRLVTLRGGPARPAGSAGPGTIAFARIENHFVRHRLWLEEGQLLARADRLRGIPGVIVQGRFDVVTPPATAHALARAWPDGELRLVEGAGHAFAEPGILHELLAATDRFATVAG